MLFCCEAVIGDSEFVIRESEARGLPFQIPNPESRTPDL